MNVCKSSWRPKKFSGFWKPYSFHKWLNLLLSKLPLSWKLASLYLEQSTVQNTKKVDTPRFYILSLLSSHSQHTSTRLNPFDLCLHCLAWKVLENFFCYHHCTYRIFALAFTEIKPLFANIFFLSYCIKFMFVVYTLYFVFYCRSKPV